MQIDFAGATQPGGQKKKFRPVVIGYDAGARSLLDISRKETKMDDGLECKSCQQADTFDVLCDLCQSQVFKRTDRLINRLKQAKQKSEKLCKELGPKALEVITSLDREFVTDEELVTAFNRHAVNESDISECIDRFLLTVQLIKSEDEREGYAELAEISSRIFFDENYIENRVRKAFDPADISKQKWDQQ